MGSTRARLTLAFFVVVGAIVFASSGSAGPRNADATFEAFPGPGTVSYGELIAYKAEFTTLSDSVLTHVRFRQTIPAAGSVTATFDSSTCPSTPTTTTTSSGTEWICDFGQIRPGAETKELTIVWRVPALDVTTNCPECLVSTGRWTVKEGVNDTTDPNDSFGRTETKATLLGVGQASQETLRAGGYETAGTSCDEAAATGNLRTHGPVSLANPVVTKFCLPDFEIPEGNGNLGFATTITELAGNARHSEVCIAELGTNCTPTALDATFGAPYVTNVFQVANGALPKGYKITEVSHNGNPPLEEGECSAPGECVLSIDLDNRTKIWTIVATSATNGYWDW